MSASPTIHASAVRFAGRGVLIRGASGSGKSALALALLFADGDARLIADDRVALSVEGGRLVARVPAPIAGKLEVRGQGIIAAAHVSPALIDLVVDLRPIADCPRMPSPADAVAEIDGIVLPRLILPAGAADGAVRVRVALHGLVKSDFALRAKPLALRNRLVKIAASPRAGARRRDKRPVSAPAIGEKAEGNN